MRSMVEGARKALSSVHSCGMGFQRPTTVKRARALRRRMSLPEVLLWLRILERAPGRPTFRRQHPFGPYILAFYCDAARLCVEVDGACAHEGDEPQARDASRQGYLESEGIRVVRLAAADVLRDADGAAAAVMRIAGWRPDEQETCAALRAAMNVAPVSPLHRPAGGPPPPGGERREQRVLTSH